MDENIINIGILTDSDDTPQNILEKAKEWGMKACVIIGEDENGKLRFGGSHNDPRLISWLLTQAQWFVQENEFKRHV
jgi:FMN phosphatase YigB (HAD superfamily)